MKKLTIFLGVLLLVWGGQTWAASQNDQIEFSRSLLQVGKKKVIAENMNFTEQESAAFWKVYQTYQTDLQAVNDRLVNLIKDYADHFNTLTAEQSKKMVRDNLAINMDQIKVREKYLKDFEKIMPAQKVARFYQIENKIDAAVRYELAGQIPLVPLTKQDLSQSN